MVMVPWAGSGRRLGLIMVGLMAASVCADDKSDEKMAASLAKINSAVGGVATPVLDGSKSTNPGASAIKELEDSNDALRCLMSKEDWASMKKTRKADWETRCGAVSKGESLRLKVKDGGYAVYYSSLLVEHQQLLGIGTTCATHKANYIAYTMKKRLADGVKTVKCGTYTHPDEMKKLGLLVLTGKEKQQEEEGEPLTSFDYHSCNGKEKFDLEKVQDYYQLSFAMNEIIEDTLQFEKDGKATWDAWGCKSLEARLANKPQTTSMVPKIDTEMDDTCAVHFKDTVNRMMSERYGNKKKVVVDLRNEELCCPYNYEKGVPGCMETPEDKKYIADKGINCKCGAKYDLAMPDEYQDVWNLLLAKAICMVKDAKTCHDFCCDTPEHGVALPLIPGGCTADRPVDTAGLAKCNTCEAKWKQFLIQSKTSGYLLTKVDDSNENAGAHSTEWKTIESQARMAFAEKHCLKYNGSDVKPNFKNAEEQLQIEIDCWNNKQDPKCKPGGGDNPDPTYDPIPINCTENKTHYGADRNCTAKPEGGGDIPLEVDACKGYKPMCDQCKKMIGSELVDKEELDKLRAMPDEGLKDALKGVKGKGKDMKDALKGAKGKLKGPDAGDVALKKSDEIIKGAKAGQDKKDAKEKKKKDATDASAANDKAQVTALEKIKNDLSKGDMTGLTGAPSQADFKDSVKSSLSLGPVSQFMELEGTGSGSDTGGDDCSMTIPRCIRVGESWIDSSFTYLPKMICAVDGQPFLEIPRDLQEVAYRMEAPKNPATKGAYFTVDFVLRSEWPKALQEEFFGKSVGNSVTCHTPDELVFSGYMLGECKTTL